MVSILYAVLLFYLFNIEINHIWLLPSSGKLPVVLDIMQLRFPLLYRQIELILEIFHQRVSDQDATRILNNYQQIIIKNPYLESDYLTKLAVNTRAQNI